MQIDLSPDDVSALMAHLPEAARSRDSGFLYDGTMLTVPKAHEAAVKAVMKQPGWQTPPEPVPASISDRQFAQGLALKDIISREEALAFVRTGTMPDALKALVEGIPDEGTRFSVEMLVSGATVFERHSPFVDQLASGYGWSPQQTDEFWRFCGGL